jgi:hypothetical protein
MNLFVLSALLNEGCVSERSLQVISLRHIRGYVEEKNLKNSSLTEYEAGAERTKRF